jgi:ribosomal protein S18 acetylase RimI-like enzyme
VIVESFADQAAFRAAVEPLLLADEAENNLLLGLIARTWPVPPLMRAVREDGQVRGCALMTAGRMLVVSRLTESALNALAGALHGGGVALPGVNGPEETSSAFVGAWTALKGASADQGVGMCLYRAGVLTAPTEPPGAVRAAGRDDLPRLREWMAAFNRETGDDPAFASALSERFVAESRALLRVDPAGTPLSLAARVADTPNGARIGAVYTPPEQRRRGYASSLVAELTLRLQAQGKVCFLFTDAANPTSNGIYRAIGYRQIGVFRAFRFLAR